MTAPVSDVRPVPTATSDVRLASTLALTAAVLAIIGNALHPFFAADMTTEEFLAAIRDTGALWIPVHLVTGLSAVLAVAAIVLFARLLAGTPGAAAGRVAAVVAVVSGAIFAGQVTGMDGVGLKMIADAAGSPAAGDPDALVAAARAFTAMDFGLFTFSVLFFLGVTVAVFGLAITRSTVVPAWVGWLAIVGGIVCVVGGVVLAYQPNSAFAQNVLVRGGAALDTLALLGAGWTVRRSAGVIVARPATSAG